MSTTPFFGGNTHVVHGGHFLSVEQMELAADLRERHVNLKLVWIPPEHRGPEDQGREFAIIDTYDGDTPVMRMSPEQVNRSYIFGWLYENDGNRAGNRIEDRIIRAEEKRLSVEKQAKEENNAQLADFMTTVVRSGKSDFKHNGIKLTDRPDTLGGMLDVN